MSIDLIIENLISRQVKTAVKLESPPRLKGTVVTIARHSGAGGEDVAQILADRLGLHCYDQDLLDAMAKEARVDKELMQHLDEEVAPMITGWVQTIIGGKGAFKEDFRRALVKVALGIAHTGGVIVGRGVNFILSGDNVFRVRVVGSDEVRAKRFAEKHNLTPEKAAKIIKETDRRRERFVRKVFPLKKVKSPKNFDLIVNTDDMSFEQAAELVLFAMKQKGFEVPEPESANRKKAASAGA